MVGVIDVGGGMRGMYGAGVLDRCLADGVMFDYCCGVSAGSANLITYQAGQPGRTYRFYHEYAFRKHRMGIFKGREHSGAGRYTISSECRIRQKG